MLKDSGRPEAGIEPSRDGLLVALRAHLSNGLIQRMAESDVLIPAQVEANKRALQEIKETGAVPGCLPWNPAEVCNLLRWAVRADHETSLMKMFGCWILIRAYVQVESLDSGLVDQGDEHAVVALVEAALDLGADFPAHAACFLYWAYLALLEAGEHRGHARPFYLFGFVIAAAAAPGLVSNRQLVDAWHRLQEEEQRVRDAMATMHSHGSESRGFPLWLLGLVGDDLNNFQDRCRDVTRRLCAMPWGDADEARRRLLNDILSRWHGARPAGAGVPDDGTDQ